MDAVKMRFWHDVQQKPRFLRSQFVVCYAASASSNANSIYLQKISRTGEQPTSFVQFKPIKTHLLVLSCLAREPL
jgi:hypothetical protein